MDSASNVRDDDLFLKHSVQGLQVAKLIRSLISTLNLRMKTEILASVVTLEPTDADILRLGDSRNYESTVCAHTYLESRFNSEPGRPIWKTKREEPQLAIGLSAYTLLIPSTLPNAEIITTVRNE